MKKILFLEESKRTQLNREINHQLKIKNNLLRVLYENDAHKLSRVELQKLVNKHEEAIFLLERIRRLVNEASHREDIKYINELIEFYHSHDT